MPNKHEYYIGLMSGTSMDGVDAVLVDLANPAPHLVATHQEPIPGAMQQSLRRLSQPGKDEIDRLGSLDVEVGLLFAQAAQRLLTKANMEARQIVAIGSHGQTVRHRPESDPPFTLQIGDPNTIAHHSGITTVADFRRRDMAAGGEGAPLVPGFHADVFRQSGKSRIILNIGGIANVTLLPANTNQPIRGFDTGPGNTLLDYWCRRHLETDYDESGAWAAQGTCSPILLQQMLNDPYLKRHPPKSTGPEYFSPDWLTGQLHGFSLPPEDIQATLLELTSCSIAQAITIHAAESEEVLVCGGGVHNTQLMSSLSHQLATMTVLSCAHYDVDPDWVEAIAFAWLARRSLKGLAGNLPEVTGAKQAVILGGIYPA